MVRNERGRLRPGSSPALLEESSHSAWNGKRGDVPCCCCRCLGALGLAGGECAAAGLLCWHVCTGGREKGVRLQEHHVTVATDVLDVSFKCAWPVLCCMAAWLYGVGL